jgi:hypothetical protein
MERGYLAGLLLVLAVFTGMTHGFRSLEQWSSMHIRHVVVMAKSECRGHSMKQGVAQRDTQLSPQSPENAQLLAQLDLPSELPSDMTQAIAGKEIAGLSCARAKAMQEAERARRDMLRAQRELMQLRVQPVSVKVSLPPDFAQQVQESTAAAMKVARQQMQLSLQIQKNRLHAAIGQASSDQQ